MFQRFPSGALITHRDGIVGPWQTQTAIWFPETPTNTAANLARWAPDMRAKLFPLNSCRACTSRQTRMEPPARPRILVSRQDDGWRCRASCRNMGTLCVNEAAAGADAVWSATQSRQRLVDLRGDRIREIHLQKTFSFLSGVQSFRCARIGCRRRWSCRRCFATGLVCWAAVQTPCASAPTRYSPQVQPVITTPGHGSLPSGHATQAFAVAQLLLDLQATAATNNNSLLTQQLMAQAARRDQSHRGRTSLPGRQSCRPVLAGARRLLACTLPTECSTACACRTGRSYLGASTVVDATIGDFSGGEFYDAVQAKRFATKPFAKPGGTQRSRFRPARLALGRRDSEWKK